MKSFEELKQEAISKDIAVRIKEGVFRIRYYGAFKEHRYYLNRKRISPKEAATLCKKGVNYEEANV